ncbi:hypothetical protein ACE1CI_35940 [Aerosakkonemataceae cyanobacterium BLCC-F50]|uniref:Uncharacterized protein n=1 Tax=Floridaenema flaviceps BLCC-F50 TaxID=3153642 RepID=A0ABV4Y3N7_9CYAN
MSFSVFNESFYLAHNPDVQTAVKAGYFSSGLEHFQKFGLAEGRVSVSPFYNEQYYLRKNSDVATEVAFGTFRSGLQHFILAGEAEGRVSVSPFYDERFYLQKNSDVATAVASGNFRSGLQHFFAAGEAENRVFISPFYDEQYYLQKNPDVATAVASGIFRSGLQHFILAGETEGRRASLLFDGDFYLQKNQAGLLIDVYFYSRKNPGVAAQVADGRFSSALDHYLQVGKLTYLSGTNFNEFGYIGLSNFKKVNPDVEAAVKAGYFGSTLEHYITYGQFEGRGGIFNGTKGNDTVIGFGQLDTLYGVDAFIGENVSGGTPFGGQALHFGFGVNEVNEADVLVGGNGQDTFVLGQASSGKNLSAYPFYRGNGDADYARIKNYEIGKDEIVLAGAASNYDFVQAGDSLNIILSRSGDEYQPLPLAIPDLIAQVEGVTSVSQIESKLRFERGYVY